jgi:hypothetical protein
MRKYVLGAIFASVVAFWPLAGHAQQTTPQPTATPDPPAFQYDAFDNQWHASVTPYLWAPGIGGQLIFRRPVAVGVGLATIAVSTGPSNYLGFFNFGALIAGEVRKNAFDVSADVIWLNLSHYGSSTVTITGPLGNVQIPISSTIGWRLTTTMWELEPGLVFTHGTGGNGVFFAGVRSIGTTGAVSWAFTGPIDLVSLTGSASNSATITDFITGVRGRVALGGRWFMPLYGDVGWGGQNNTDQWYAGIGHAERWGSLELFYRQLYYNQTNTDARLRNLQLGGLALGATINL